MPNKICEITIRDCKGKSSKYEIIINEKDDMFVKEKKLYVNSETQLIEKFGGFCSETFDKIKLINELEHKIKQETLEGLKQITNLNNKYYEKTFKSKEKLRFLSKKLEISYRLNG